MHRTLFRHALYTPTHVSNHSLIQFRQVHKNVSKLPNRPQRGEAKVAEHRGYAQSSPINVSHFRSLVEQPDVAVRKKYRLRWDWHVRNFLSALGPPAALLICIQLIKWRFAEDMDEHAHLFPTEGLLNEARDENSFHASEESKDSGMTVDMKASLNERLMERLDRLEKEIDLLRAQRSAKDGDLRNQGNQESGAYVDIVAEAGKISKNIARRGHNPAE